MLRTAIEAGAVVVNYAEATDFIKTARAFVGLKWRTGLGRKTRIARSPDHQRGRPLGRFADGASGQEQNAEKKSCAQKVFISSPAA